MSDIFVFSLIALFAGLLGMIIGGPFRIFVLENNAIESPLARSIFGFLFFPPVVGVALLILYYLFAENPQLGSEHWGAIVGLVSGMSYAFVQIGQKNE
jgi:hypothetical protein